MLLCMVYHHLQPAFVTRTSKLQQQRSTTFYVDLNVEERMWERRLLSHKLSMVGNALVETSGIILEVASSFWAFDLQELILTFG